jgi:hypothetical protein
MLLLTGVVRILLTRWAPDWVGAPSRPQLGHVYVNLGSNLLGAAGGGYVTAWIDAGDPLRAMLALGIVVLVLGGVSALQARGKEPIWYQLALIAVAPAGVFAGGLLRLRVLGIL